MQSKMEKSSSEENRIIQERKAQVLNFFKKKYNWISYVVLAFIVLIAVWIRTRNLPGLKDITTGTWTLGPDLDPFLFLRWAKYIVENGSLMAIDTMRYVPLGFETKYELLLLPYMIVWFHKIFGFFGAESVTHSAVILPAFMFALTVIAFFLLTRKIFISNMGEKKSNVIALIASVFLAVHPALLPRTIAGIPEKESIAFFIMFLTFYLFLCAWKSDHKIGKYVYGFFAGVTTGLMALAWGGYIYIFVTIGLALLIALLFGQIDRRKFITTLIWLVSALALMTLYSSRYTLKNLANSTVVLVAAAPLVIFCVSYLLFNTKLKKYVDKGIVKKIPRPILAIIVTIILGTIVMIILTGPGFIADTLQEISRPLITPISDRLGVTVAENRQPYFSEWASSFGPIFLKVPLFFWLFFFGSVYLFYKTFHAFSKKEKTLVTSSYFIFLLAIIFSRYSPDSVLNGTNAFSILVYLAGVIILISSIAFVYYRKSKRDSLEAFTAIDFSLIFLFSLFFFSVVSARGAVRTIMVLVPSASILASFLIVSLYAKIKSTRDRNRKIAVIVIFALILIFSLLSAFRFYQESVNSAKVYVPGIYNQQWQKAMSWVRENTPGDAVFAHWWDYGYWVQSIGERATVLDGGNAQAYWNHFMGRYALTGTSSSEAAEFLYAHGTTHFLIDSTDIGKYGAFSSIGSDPNYDRRSSMSILLRDDSRVAESKNSTSYVYLGGMALEEDIIYQDGENEIFLPGVNNADVNLPLNIAGLGAVGLEITQDRKLLQPTGVFVYQNKQYQLPLRYAYYNGSFIDFGTGIEAGIFLMPTVGQASNGQIQIAENGALIYMSKRTVKSQLARLYLYGEEDEFFQLAHTEDDFLIASVKSQGVDIGEFVYYGGLRGPIKIWEVNYPVDMEINPKFLETLWPEELWKV